MQKEQYEAPVLDVVDVWAAVRTDADNGEADPDNVVSASSLGW